MRTIARQRGAALLIMMALIAMGGAYLLVSALGTATSRTAVNREASTRALFDARSALLGWVATKALESGELNPGRLPCPESLADAGTPGEGTAASFCTLPAVGRLPWKTLGLPRLVDSAGEPLWYVVGADWANYSAIASLIINSDTPGQLTVDGTANAAVALIIAPGAPVSVQASANCAARTQLRQALPPDLRDYLECQNASSPADATFATSGPSDSFNDQVLQVRTQDLMPVIEAAIAKRIERDLVPALRTVYAGSATGQSSGDAVFPYAAPFANPGTSAYQGAAGTMQGLLPFNYSQGCPVGDARCSASFVSWATPTIAKVGGGGSLWGAPSCVTQPTYGYCADYYYGGSVSVRLSDPMPNVANALRAFDVAGHVPVIWAYDYDTGTWSYPSPTVTRGFNGDGSFSFTIDTTLPATTGWGYYYVIGYRPVFSDHSVLDTANATTGWFVRNQWYRFVYYAVAPSQAASGAAPRNCQDASGSCLTVTNLAGTNKRAVLVLGGRQLANQVHPSANLSDYLENAENRNGDTTFTQDRVGPATNDRIVILDQSS